jgi:hypothetical protein
MEILNPDFIWQTRSIDLLSRVTFWIMVTSIVFAVVYQTLIYLLPRDRTNILRRDILVVFATLIISVTGYILIPDRDTFIKVNVAKAVIAEDLERKNSTNAVNQKESSAYRFNSLNTEFVRFAIDKFQEMNQKRF